MKRKKNLEIIILLICIVCFLLLLNYHKNLKEFLSLQQNNKNINLSNKSDIDTEIKNNEEGINLNINIIINDQIFTTSLIDSKTSRKFISLLPFEVTMNDLNRNEKYNYLEESLPTDSYNPKKVNEGDLMLYGSDCLVLFYETFATDYRYTKLGTITNPKKLKKVVGKGSVKVRFEIGRSEQQ